MAKTREELEQIKNLVAKGQKTFWVKYDDNSKEKLRFFISSNEELCYYGKNMKRKGYSFEYVFLTKVNEITPVVSKTPKQKWEKNLNVAIKLLTESELWPELLNEMKIAKKLGYDKMQEIYKIDNDKFTENYLENNKIKITKIKQIAPEIIKINEENNEYVPPDLKWWLTYPLKFKSMYFGKYYNSQYKEQIKQALENKEKHHISTTVNYDVSFEYNGKEKAWYSEEYRGCGNGHYYLALNHNLAVHYEDD
jgi:hypothetical protein